MTAGILVVFAMIPQAITLVKDTKNFQHTSEIANFTRFHHDFSDCGVVGSYRLPTATNSTSDGICVVNSVTFYSLAYLLLVILASVIVVIAMLVETIGMNHAIEVESEMLDDQLVKIASGDHVFQGLDDKEAVARCVAEMQKGLYTDCVPKLFGFELGPSVGATITGLMTTGAIALVTYLAEG